MFTKTVAGLIIAVAAIGVAPIAASAAISHSAQVVAEPAADAAKPADAANGLMPVIGLWAGVGVLGLAGGMVSIATISRKHKLAGSRVTAAIS